MSFKPNYLVSRDEGVVFSIQVSKDVHRALKALAKENNSSLSKIAHEAVQYALDSMGEVK